MKITVVGSGFVGQTTAMRILEKGLGEVVLIDIIEGKPQGIALDLKQAAAIEGYEPTIVGTNDYADTAGSDIVVITAGFPRQPGMSRMDLLAKNAAIMRDVIAKAKAGTPVLGICNGFQILCESGLLPGVFHVFPPSSERWMICPNQALV